jgi:hypothetical protein
VSWAGGSSVTGEAFLSYTTLVIWLTFSNRFGAVVETEVLGELLRNMFPGDGRNFSFGFDH